MLLLPARKNWKQHQQWRFNNECLVTSKRMYLWTYRLRQPVARVLAAAAGYYGYMRTRLNFKDFDFFMNPWFHSNCLLVLFTPNIQGKIECFCIYFSSMLYDNLLLFSPSFYNNLKPILKFTPPLLFWPPVYYHSEIFPTPFFLWSPIYLVLDSNERYHCYISHPSFSTRGQGSGMRRL